jgi:acyl-coenzyme A thioesterase PaaI-like protein
MATSLDAPGGRILALWSRLAPFPGGRRVFSLILRLMVPYSGTLGARVEELAPGRARVRLRDRRRVRNHLRSVHAVALTNVGELASGLALLTALPPGVRGIVTGLETSYHHKARGLLVARSEVAGPTVTGAPEAWFGQRVVETLIDDAAGRTVATFRATWLLGPS